MQDGAPGIPGAKGEPGENGAKWHTGVGAPEVSLGDKLATSTWTSPMRCCLSFRKVGRDWIFLANLKVPPSGGGGGQSGAAGGGGSVIIYPKPDGGAPPDKDNDGNPSTRVTSGTTPTLVTSGFTTALNGYPSVSALPSAFNRPHRCGIPQATPITATH